MNKILSNALEWGVKILYIDGMLHTLHQFLLCYIIYLFFICTAHEMVVKFDLTCSYSYFFMLLVDVLAYVHKKKKLVSSHHSATTAVKTSVSLQIYLKCMFWINLNIFWDGYVLVTGLT